MELSNLASLKAADNVESLAQAAIAAALSQNWQQAAKINEKIILLDSENVEALNRLARAQACLGHRKLAEKTYKKVLEIDPYNIIALKNMEKLTKANGGGLTLTLDPSLAQNQGNTNLSRVFLDEPGKTKLVSLLNLAPPSTLAALSCGDQLILKCKNHAISVSSNGGTYLGAFPDDLAHRLLGFISGGNQYEAYVKSSSTKNLTIIVRETLRSEKFGNQPSFASRASIFEEDSRS